MSPGVSAYVVLLRGINVGGHAKVAMPALREVCAEVGCADVSTYIQSGNVVLTSELSPPRLTVALAKAIADRFDASPDVMIRTADELTAVIDNNPYPRAADGTLHVGFLARAADSAARDSAGDIVCGPEEFTIRGSEIYFHLPNGIGNSKLAPLVTRRVKIPMTTRNWRTVLKLHEMARAL